MKKIKLALAVTCLLSLAGLFNFTAPAKAFEDNTAPTVVSLTLSPTEVNTSDFDQTITATMEIRDAGVGFCEYNAPGCPSYSENNSSHAAVQLIPQIGTSTQQRTFSSWTRISGDDNDGVWQSTVTLPWGSKVGIWEVGNYLAVQVTDKLGNYRIYSENNSYANSYGYDHLDTIANTTRQIANTATSDSVRIEKEWTISSSNVSATFPANTIVTRGEGGEFAFYRMVNQTFEIADVTTDGVTDGSVVAGKVKVGIPGLNLSFDKPVRIDFTVDGKYDGKTLSIVGLTEGAGSWANETSCTVSAGICSFTVNHASYFMALASGGGAGITDGSVGISSSTFNFAYTTKKKTKKSSFTLTGVRLAKKKHVTVRLGNHKVKVISIRRTGSNTRIGISFKYRRWARSDYAISLSYKVKQNKRWSRGSYSQSGFMSIY